MAIGTEFVASATNVAITNGTRVDIETVTGKITAEDIALAVRTFDLLATQAVYGDDACTILNAPSPLSQPIDELRHRYGWS
ncbi:hypothetical protein ACFU44_10800 [Nocardia rhizosphaerihabitans]|uniref:hypothetical protein n=1 Tax=Nocardia rhizosphaerihabitans TaxID=1691570 RepID=UPI00366D8EA8